MYYTVQFSGSVTVGGGNPIVEWGYLKHLGSRVIITSLDSAEHFADAAAAAQCVADHLAYYAGLAGVVLDPTGYSIQRQGA
jgi:hypothetical protein